MKIAFYNPIGMIQKFAAFVAGCSIVLFSCRSVNDKPKDALFQLMPSSQTGIDFNNSVTDTKDFNIFKYRNFYNGAGVAIGDVNNDGKPDIFFTANQQQNKLYINKGNWQFEDVTEKVGLQSSHHWHTGVTMADVNGDHWLDIYVCNSGDVQSDDKANELYINQKNGTFKEEAHEYGLDDKGLSTQATFFDYDNDGDLDCFVLNNSTRSTESFGYGRSFRNQRDPKNGDRLYRNNLISTGNSSPPAGGGGRQGAGAAKFTDVSEQAGIYGSEISFGLGITVGDLNNDGWQDMYISNDFFEKDYLYINQQNGTFKEVINEAMGHLSQGSMGSDVADLNNDGYLDVFTTEMLPEDDYRLKTIIKFEDYDVLNAKLQNDYHHQFITNCLQLNNHDGTFSEIAQMSGVDATGWSWGALCFDFDNDGWKDIYVCNGISRDLTDQDFLAFFGSEEVLTQVSQGTLNYLDLIEKMPSVPLLNYAFVNQKNLLFKNQTRQLGFTVPSFSHGASYADLDSDGDLDLVINNENSEAFVYRNNTAEKLHHHYLKIKLKGNALNTFGIGARVTAFINGNKQVLEQIPCRGFQSAVEPVLLFGMGNNTVADSIIIQWPGLKEQVIKNIPADTTLVCDQAQAVNDVRPVAPKTASWYENVTGTAIKGAIQHHENDFVDFDKERLIPKMLSTEGPKLATADVNGDGLEDFYIGSAMGDTAKIFIQQPNGHFIQKVQPAFIADKYYETIGAAFFDADEDGDQDLVTASGGNQAASSSPYLFPRLYLNDSKGNFTRSTTGWPAIGINASCVRVGDFNGDGHKDIFIGARSIPGSYGVLPNSLLFENNGGGHFTDVTNTAAPELLHLGMVTDAQWADIDKDGTNELIIVGDWMPVTVMKPVNGRLKKVQTIPNSAGWWNCVQAVDIDEDGDVDIIAGNNGLNSRIKTDVQHPAKMYVDDFDKNGQTECIPIYFKTDGKAYPYFLKGEIDMQLPMLKKNFLRFSEYAGKSIEEIFPGNQLQHASVLTVNNSQTCIFSNNGKAQFTIQPLPLMAQLSPVFGILVTDLNGDGLKDLFMAGNFYSLKPQNGRFDASYGTTLLANKQHQFSYLEPAQSGLFINGEARDIVSIKAKRNDYVIVAMNNAPLYIFRKRQVASGR